MHKTDLTTSHLFLIELTWWNALQLLIKSVFSVKSKWRDLIFFLDVFIDQDFYFALEKGLQWWITLSTEPSWKEVTLAVKRCVDNSIAATLKRQLDIADEGICSQ